MQEEEAELSADQPGAPPPPATAPTPKPKPAPKLTAEEQAQWEAKLKLIVEQLAKPNTRWDQRGASACAQGIAAEPVVFVDLLVRLPHTEESITTTLRMVRLHIAVGVRVSVSLPTAKREGIDHRLR